MLIYVMLLFQTTWAFAMQETTKNQLLPQGELILENRSGHYLSIYFRTELIGKTKNPKKEKENIAINNGVVETHMFMNPGQRLSPDSARTIVKKFGKYTKQTISVWGITVIAKLFILNSCSADFDNPHGTLVFCNQTNGHEFMLFPPNKYVIEGSNGVIDIKKLVE